MGSGLTGTRFGLTPRSFDGGRLTFGQSIFFVPAAAQRRRV